MDGNRIDAQTASASVNQQAEIPGYSSLIFHYQEMPLRTSNEISKLTSLKAILTEPDLLYLHDYRNITGDSRTEYKFLCHNQKRLTSSMRQK